MASSTTADRRETVLVVEDEILIRHVIADYLRDCGFKVIEAATADEAIALLRHTEVEIHIVFSDVEMPGSMDGFSLAKWLRENRPSVAVILTGNVSRAADAAADLCEESPLPKPYQPQIAADRIRHLLALRSARTKKK